MTTLALANGRTIKVHPAADLFPMMSPAETVAEQRRVRIRYEIAIGEKEKLDESDFRALVGGQRRGYPRFGAGRGGAFCVFIRFQIYVSHVDIFWFAD